MENKSSAVGLISGGLDSTVVAAYMDKHYDASYFLFADYGQKTLVRERQAFDALCDHFEPEGHEVVDLTWMRRIGTSALFEDDTFLDAGNRRREYVPFRNANLLAAGVALAETVKANTVLIGSTGGDLTCPDNSMAFLNAFQQVIHEGTMTDEEILIVAPLIDKDKKGVIELGMSLDAPFELSWSCHNNNGNVACGQCSNCSARHTAFTELNQQDPLEYQD
jgi:7-cyano-7-deazaguanine synthase